MSNSFFSRRNFLAGMALSGSVSGISVAAPFRAAPEPVVVPNYPLFQASPSGGPVKIFSAEELTLEAVKQIRSVADNIDLIQCNASELKERAAEAEVILGMVNREIILRSSRLKWVQTWAAGVEWMPQELIEHSCVVTNMQRVFAPVIAESVFALLLSLTRGLTQSSIPNLREHRWAEASCPLEDLYQKTMGIVGLGGIGSETARRAHYGFGMHVMAVDPKPLPKPEFVAELWEPGKLLEMVSQVDVLVSCAPSTRETQNIFNEALFRRMKPTAYFINVSRGALVDQNALARALKEGWIRAAGLDVTTPEPLSAEDPLWTCPNLVITPHNSGAAPVRELRMNALVVENVRRYAKGLPLLNVVDKRRGY